MKRTLLLASFLGLGFALYAQSAGAADKGSALPGSRGPNAQVRVSPGPQGLPVVDSSASAWSLAPAPGESLDYWLNGAPQTGESEEPAPPPRTSNQVKPSFEPPPMGGLPSFGGPRPGGEKLRNPVQNPPELRQNGVQEDPLFRNSLQNGQTTDLQASAASLAEAPRQEAPRQEAPRRPQDGPPPAARQNPAPVPANPPSPDKRVIVVPSPVHYDRAGRRVVDPGWQETMYQMIQAEKQTASPALEQSPAAGPGGAGQAGEGNGNQGARDDPAVRETVIVVPGPAIWRIRGTLTAARGMLALEDNEGILWYLPGLDRYIGFIDGLEAGGEAALEGYAPPRGSSQERYFQPIRLFIDETVYDLTISPYETAIPARRSGGQTTIIREIERRDSDRNPGRGARGNQDAPGGGDDPAPRSRGRRERSRQGSLPAPPAWEHHHSSPWAPPPSVLEFEMDYDSIWREDEAKRRQRERDSREIWY